DSSAGSRMVALKNRWLTERSSTATRAVPTTPSAAPNPVMLRITCKLASYGMTTILSISVREVPANAIVVDRPRHREPGNHLVLLVHEVPVLVGERGRQ